MSPTRREFLNYALYSSGALAMRSLVSGIPISVLANPRRGLAQIAEHTASTASPTFLIYATSSQGDPVNCNAPGTYIDQTIYHPDDPSMAPTTFNLGTQEVVAAKVWSTLDGQALPNTCFFHHATYTNGHPDETSVLSVRGRMASNEMLVSTVGRQLQVPLNTIQAAPISVAANSSSESVYFGGAPQHIYSPAQLATILAPAALGPSGLQTLRDNTVDTLNAWTRSNATPAQQKFLDAYVRSQQQARQVPDALLASLSALKDNTVASQIQAALILFQMRITPAVVVHIDFGDDNHSDAKLANEIAQHTAGVSSLNAMISSIRQLNMQDQITFCMSNVFGRQIFNGPTDGRGHNGQHHVSVMIGPNVKGGVVGGVSNTSNGYVATAIDSVSGSSVNAGDIGYVDTFSAQAKTLLAVTGVPPVTVDTLVTGGAIVQSALATTG